MDTAKVANLYVRFLIGCLKYNGPLPASFIE